MVRQAAGSNARLFSEPEVSVWHAQVMVSYSEALNDQLATRFSSSLVTSPATSAHSLAPRASATDTMYLQDPATSTEPRRGSAIFLRPSFLVISCAHDPAIFVSQGSESSWKEHFFLFTISGHNLVSWYLQEEKGRPTIHGFGNEIEI